jgi:hypothetical protein
MREFRRDTSRRDYSLSSGARVKSESGARPGTTDLTRVAARIGAAVLEFCGRTSQFHMADLAAFVEGRIGSVAPDSAGRILRQLRRAGTVNYRVVDRSASLYEIVNPTPTPRKPPEARKPQPSDDATLFPLTREDWDLG